MKHHPSLSLPTNLVPFFLHFSKPYRLPFAVFFLAPLFLALEATALPYSLKMIVDTVSTHEGSRDDIWQKLAPALWLGGGAWMLMIVVFRLQEWWQCYVLPKFEADIRLAMFTYVRGHSHRYFSERFAGNLSNKLSDIVSALRSLSMMLRWRIISTASVTLAALVVMATVSWIFSLLLGVWALLQIAVVYGFAKRADMHSRQNAEDRSALSGRIVDVFSNNTAMRLFARGAYEDASMRSLQQEEYASNKKTLLVMSNAKLIVEIPSTLLAGALFYFLIDGWREGTVSSGDFVFIFYASFNVVQHVWFLSMELPELFREIGVARQALSLIASPHEIVDAPDAKPLEVRRGEIAFEGVHFQYIPGKDIFRDKNIIISAGERVGLVGFSGSGKSTFVNLILRLFEVEQGRILIDEQDIKHVTQDSLRAAIAMIPQDATLFHRSLYENIAYGRPDATHEEVEEAARRAHCEDFIREIPGGMEAMVGERGVKLSGGQRQRIAIARAILKDAPIVILDEATSALDSVTEKQIQSSLKDLMQGRTVIVIAHRLSTLTGLDRILVFSDGEIIEEGAHEDLLAQGGHYAMLWRMQLDGFLPDIRNI